MSSKYIKFQSQEAGLFSKTNNRVNFTIDKSLENVSLKDSYLEFDVRVNVSNSALPTGVYKSALAWSNDGTQQNKIGEHFQNATIVKNCYIKSDMGMMDNIRDNHILRQNLQMFQKNYDNIVSENYMAANPVIDPENFQHGSMFQEINKIGSISSRNNDSTPVRIRLGELMDFCNLDNCDMSAMGDLHVHTELNIGNIVAEELVDDNTFPDKKLDQSGEDYTNGTQANVDLNTITSVDDNEFVEGEVGGYYFVSGENDGSAFSGIYKLANRQVQAGKTLLTFADPFATVLPAKVVNNIKFQYQTSQLMNTGVLVGADTPITELTTKTKWTDLAQCPYYIGLPVHVTGYCVDAQGGNRANFEDNAVISRMEYEIVNGLRTGRLVITLDRSVGTVVNGKKVEAANMEIVPPNSHEVEWLNAQIVVKQLVTKAPMGQYVWTTYSTYQLHGNGQTSFHDVYEIDGNSYAMLLMPIYEDISAVFDNIKTYRLRLNNEDLSDRPVHYPSALNNDLTMRTFNNMRYRLANLTRPVVEQNSEEFYTPGSELCVIASPLFLTAGRKNLQVDIESTAALGAFNLYLAEQRVI